jgi:hypothetical protein
MKYEDILPGHKPEIIAIADKLREIVLSEDEAIAEDIFGGQKVRMASYSIGAKTNVVGVIGMAEDHCKIFLHHLDQVPTRDLPFEGKGKHARHVKLFQIEDLDEERYRSVIHDVVVLVKTQTESSLTAPADPLLETPSAPASNETDVPDSTDL